MRKSRIAEYLAEMLALRPPIDPMLAKLAAELPSEGCLYEPKWDGFRALVFKDGDEVYIQSRDQKPFNRYFPELEVPLRRELPQACVVDGEIVIARDGKLDFEALLLRIHPAASRVALLAKQFPAAYVVWDLLALDGRDLRPATQAERRAEVERVLAQAQPPIYLTPATRDRSVAEEWFRRFEGAGLDGVIAKPLDGVYEPGKRSLLKVKHERTADCAVAGYRIHKDGQGVGSLLLGLFDDDGSMHSVGVAAAFSTARRAELLAELAPRTVGALDGHPWRQWAEHQADGERGDVSTPSAGSRWNAGKDLSFVPIRMGLVAEVTFGQLEGGRFRHGVKFLRWRPDRTPESCRYDQLDVAEPVSFADFIAGSDSTGPTA
jgi:ATP-dependent DNA ligase